MGDKYIQNTHNVPITVNARDKAGTVLFTKKFMPPITEKWSGKQLTTGYEKLTDDEYGKLCESSKTFKHYKDKLKLLVVHDDMPEELKTPYQAISDFKKEIARLQAENETLKAEVAKLSKVAPDKAEKKEKKEKEDVKE